MKYECNGKHFDSSYEIAFYLYSLNEGLNIERNDREFFYLYYTPDGIQHKYYPDFCIDGVWYEVKGKHFFSEEGFFHNPFKTTFKNQSLNDAKLKCMIEHKVILVNEDDLKPAFDYMEQTYGKDWKHKPNTN